MACSIATAWGGGWAGFGGGDVCSMAKFSPNCATFPMMSKAEAKRKNAAANTATRS
jgi:hypothetical protein